ncbi:hypothetical protein ACIRYZ_27660 [Kitasatospora sp. NPDC101155]|uniref:hypothetical protein n=1 Tax=Kitasatospora sp. NPDC101155 TaxID=3364097 RepID=UPI00380FA2AA
MTDQPAAPQSAPAPTAPAPAPVSAEAPAPAATPAAPEAPEAVEAAQTPEAGEAPEAAQTPGTPETPEAQEPLETPEEQAARRTRRRKAAVRWSCAVLVFALAGTGAALTVTTPERTDIPGLATANDGRYTFPPLTLPPLPSGKAAPDTKGKALHYADLRYLLLPAPKEAGGSLTAPVFPVPTATPSASSSATPSAEPSASASPTTPTASAAPSAPAGTALASWVPCDAIAAEQKEAAKLRVLLLQNVCRAATVREWTASDGTRTQIRLLRFGSTAEAWNTFSSLRTDIPAKAAPDAKTAPHSDWDTVEGVDVTLKDSPATAGQGVPTTRLAYLSASDVVAVVTMTNPQGVPAAAFRQVVTLQSDLLA